MTFQCEPARALEGKKKITFTGNFQLTTLWCLNRIDWVLFFSFGLVFWLKRPKKTDRILNFKEKNYIAFTKIHFSSKVRALQIITSKYIFFKNLKFLLWIFLKVNSNYDMGWNVLLLILLALNELRHIETLLTAHAASWMLKSFYQWFFCFVKPAFLCPVASLNEELYWTVFLILF